MKNGIYRVVALDVRIIFTIHVNFLRRLFRAVEAGKVGWNMQKFLFSNFNWVWDMECAIWPHWSGEYFHYRGRPSSTLIHRDMGIHVGQNNRKSSNFFVFVYIIWVLILFLFYSSFSDQEFLFRRFKFWKWI